MKFDKLVFLAVALASLYGYASIPALQFTEVAKKPDGGVRFMRQSSENLKKAGHKLRPGEIGAREYCDSRGQHLPTARELAQWAVSHGATGISDDPKTDYYLVRAKASDGKVDNFYYNPIGYKSSAERLGSDELWSSTVDAADGKSYYALSRNGGLIERSPATLAAVRCTENR